MIRRFSRLLLDTLAALLAGLVILAGLGAWRLSNDEPIRLGFLTVYLEQALTASDGGFTVRIDDTLLTWAGWERTFDIRARGVRAVGPDGRVIAAVPEISLSLSVRALLKGIVAPTEVDLFRPRLFLVRGLDRRFRVGRAGTQEEQAQVEESTEEGDSSVLPSLIAQMLKPPDPNTATGYLRSASIIDGELIFTDERIGMTWRAPNADIIMRRVPSGLAGDIFLVVTQRDVPARLQAEFSYDRATDRVDLSAGFNNVALAAFAEIDSDLAALSGVDLKLRGRVVTTIGLDGRIGEASVNLAAGPGTLILPTLYGDQEPRAVEQLTVTARLAAGGDRLTVDEAAVRLSGGARLTAAGTATGFASAGTPKHGWIRVAGRVAAADVQAPILGRYWPEDVARGARNWVTRNIEEGTVEHAEVNLALRIPGGALGAPVVDSLDGALSAVGLTVHYLKPMPPLRGVAGVASFTKEEFVADFASGGVEGLSIESGKLRITELDRRRDERIAIEGTAGGALPDVLRLIDHPRLGYPSKLGIVPAETAGSAVANLSFRFPAKKDLTFDDVELTVTAEVTDAEIRKVFFDRDVTHGQFDVEVTNSEMTVAGNGLFGGIPADVRWTENFSGEAFRSRIALSGRIDADQRAALGFDTRPYLDGPVSTDLLFTSFADGRSLLAADLDLTPASIELPVIEWSKPAGGPGTAKLVLELQDERAVAISDLTVDAGTLSATGRGRFAATDGRIERIELDSATFGESDLYNIAATFAEGRTDVTIGGGRLDAEPLFGDGAGDEEDEAEEEPSNAFTLRADRLDQVRLGPDRVVSDVAVALDHDGTYWQRILVDGTLPGAHPMSMRYEPAGPGTHQLGVTAADAGAALRVFGLFDNVEGGTLTIKAETDDTVPERPLRGKAEISQFRLVQAPMLARLLTVATLTGLVDVLTGEGFLFNRFTGEFTMTEDTLEVPLARAHGPSIGLTATGELDFEADAVDLEGTIVPAYAINNILGNIPVIGNILQGGKGEGLFAATYRASGSLSDPQITVNPLAALAPGFLRGLFEIFDGSGEAVPPTALPQPGGNK